MPNKDGTGNAIDGIKRIGLAAIFIVAPILLTGLYYPHWWAMMIAGGIGCGIMGKLATKGSWVNIAAWAGIGAVAGLLFSLAV